jgi:hypothetical protein
VEKTPGRMRVRLRRREAASAPLGGAKPSGPGRLIVAPALPLDARVRSVTVNGAPVKHAVAAAGDVQRAQVVIDERSPTIDVLFAYDEGTDVYVEAQELRQGAANEGLRILRARAESRTLHLTLDGRGGRTYIVGVRTPRRLGTADGVTMSAAAPGRDAQLRIRFEGPPDMYVRREISIALSQ